MNAQPMLSGMEPDNRRQYMLTPAEAAAIERMRKERRDMHGRDEYIKQIILAILRWPHTAYGIQRKINASAAKQGGHVSYYMVDKLLQELARDGKIMPAMSRGKWRRTNA